MSLTYVLLWDVTAHQYPVYLMPLSDGKTATPFTLPAPASRSVCWTSLFPFTAL